MMKNDDEKLQDFLFTNAMNGNWSNVVRKYSEDQRAHKLVITKSKDTALHLAAFGHQEEIVSKLIHIICNFNLYTDDERKRVVGKQNERMNTPLHIAACLGNVRMCKDIASVDPLLVDMRNGDGETPLFLASLHGHKTSFLCLYSFCSSNLSRLHTNSRRADGDSVLHCAVRNDYFDLAFQIANLNKEIVNWKNGEGLTPLHLLASKPAAFRSGSNIEGWKKVVYHCTFVDELKPESTGSSQALIKKNIQTNQTSYPENYRTCIDFFRLLWEGFLVVTTLKRVVMKKKKNQMKNDKANKGGRDPMKDEEANPSGMDEVDESLDIDLLERTNPEKEIFPENYYTCFNFVKVFCKAILIILGFGSTEIKKIRKKKEKHTWSNQVMEKFVEVASIYKYDDDGSIPLQTKLESDDTTETRPYSLNEMGSVGFNKEEIKDDHQEHETLKDDDQSGKTKPVNKETPVLIAAKNGVVEIVKKILDKFPVSIYDMNEEKKNVVLLAAQYRQPHVYKLLLENQLRKESVFREVDLNGNSALHLAANLGTETHKPWRIPGAALQLQWELKWYQFVKESMPLHFFVRYNNAGKIPKTIFHESHKELAKNGGEWLASTSESCSVVAALIATVAFATAATVPGGNDQIKGTPILLLLNHSAFTIFSLSSLIALCFSVTSVVMFLAILTSRFEERDFKSSLPWKLLIGLSSLFFSIVAMLVSFCTGHFFLLNHQLQNVAVLLYTIVFLPVALIFAIGQLPLYIDLLQAIIKKVPKRSSEVLLTTTNITKDDTESFSNDDTYH